LNKCCMFSFAHLIHSYAWAKIQTQKVHFFP
jgi:hypothetical protein